MDNVVFVCTTMTMISDRREEFSSFFTLRKRKSTALINDGIRQAVQSWDRGGTDTVMQSTRLVLCQLVAGVQSGTQYFVSFILDELQSLIND